jgi:multidrug efflux pump subunit AcrB
MKNFQSPGLLAWFAANPVAANLLMVILFLGGTLSLLHMDKQAFPKFDPPVINISAEYPGAGPAEVEEGVCIPIEETIHDLNGIKQIKTVAIDEKCSIKVFVEQDFDVRHLVSNLRARTESLRNLPKAVERITIDDYSWETPAITVILRGYVD